jgi:hypothetical protein
MSLDTYLPVGRGRYLIGSEPESPGSLYYFMPERRDHLRVGFEIVREGSYGETGYSDVIVHTPGTTPEKIEEGEYSIHKSGRGMRVVELRSGDMIKKYLALGQPGLGRFRFIDTTDTTATT